ncbi:hypothetical protein IWZ03DRAFT_224460 [Phyllosticta citriasiana]|uniref:Uncharacterized protein n=1 Tax=Phyllosticta citriasiana TaxID=595635 RepID=A0ABR1KH49_9PEZI
MAKSAFFKRAIEEGKAEIRQGFIEGIQEPQFELYEMLYRKYITSSNYTHVATGEDGEASTKNQVWSASSVEDADFEYTPRQSIGFMDMDWPCRKAIYQTLFPDAAIGVWTYERATSPALKVLRLSKTIKDEASRFCLCKNLLFTGSEYGWLTLEAFLGKFVSPQCYGLLRHVTIECSGASDPGIYDACKTLARFSGLRTIDLVVPTREFPPWQTKNKRWGPLQKLHKQMPQIQFRCILLQDRSMLDGCKGSMRSYWSENMLLARTRTLKEYFDDFKQEVDPTCKLGWVLKNSPEDWEVYEVSSETGFNVGFPQQGPHLDDRDNIEGNDADDDADDKDESDDESSDIDSPLRRSHSHRCPSSFRHHLGHKPQCRHTVSEWSNVDEVHPARSTEWPWPCPSSSFPSPPIPSTSSCSNCLSPLPSPVPSSSSSSSASSPSSPPFPSSPSPSLPPPGTTPSDVSLPQSPPPPYTSRPDSPPASPPPPLYSSSDSSSRLFHITAPLMEIVLFMRAFADNLEEPAVKIGVRNYLREFERELKKEVKDERKQKRIQKKKERKQQKKSKRRIE